MPHETYNRRRFLGRLGGTIVLLLPGAQALAAMRPAPARTHPEPRPGIDASRVLKADQLPSELVELYDAVRAVPHIVDGIRCYCGCADLDGFYSLLTCYEESGMALHCEVCQDEGRVAARMHGQGRTLEDIRAAIDRRFG